MPARIKAIPVRNCWRSSCSAGVGLIGDVAQLDANLAAFESAMFVRSCAAPQDSREIQEILLGEIAPCSFAEFT